MNHVHLRNSNTPNGYNSTSYLARQKQPNYKRATRQIVAKFVDADETFGCTYLYEAVLLVEDEVKTVRKRQVSNVLVDLPLAFVPLRDLTRELS